MSVLRVAIDARVGARSSGALRTVLGGLAQGFAELGEEGPRPLFLVRAGDHEWLRAAAGPGAELVPTRIGARPLDRLRSFRARFLGGSGIPPSGGVVERLGCDGVHLLLPGGFETTAPTIYQVHDLLHLHRPRDLPSSTRRRRTKTVTTLAASARRVVTMTEWGRRDVEARLGIPTHRIEVVPWGATSAAPGLAAPELPGDLPETFALYPARAYPHKNHLRLLTAIARLRERGCPIPLVLTGTVGVEVPRILASIAKLRIQGLVRILGQVEESVLQHLYRRCRCLVFPSLFEGWGLPVTEAMAHGRAVVLSSAGCLPEVAGGAARLFDPWSEDAIAEALREVWTDAVLRSRLVRRGQEVAGGLTWVATARRLATVYRESFGREPTTASLPPRPVGLPGTAPGPEIERPGLSVVIATRDRPELLRRTLEALLRQELSRGTLEVLVVDNGSSPSARPVVEDLARRHPEHALRGHRHEEPGLSAARNLGARQSRGCWVGFLDDDAVPEAGWAQAVLSAFAESAVPPLAVVGPVEPDFEDGCPSWYPRELERFDLGTVQTLLGPAGTFFGGNAAYRRDVLLELGGFDERFGLRGSLLRLGEELDLLQRMRQRFAGDCPVLYAPRMRVRHRVGREKLSLAYLLRRRFRNGQCRFHLETSSSRGAQIGRSLLRTATLTLASPFRIEMAAGPRRWAAERGALIATQLGILTAALGGRPAAEGTIAGERVP